MFRLHTGPKNIQILCTESKFWIWQFCFCQWKILRLFGPLCIGMVCEKVVVFVCTLHTVSYMHARNAYISQINTHFVPTLSGKIRLELCFLHPCLALSILDSQHRAVLLLLLEKLSKLYLKLAVHRQKMWGFWQNMCKLQSVNASFKMQFKT